MPTPAAGTIGSLDYTVEERQILAKKSCNWECSICGKISDKLNSSESGSSPELTHDETTLIQQIALKVIYIRLLNDSSCITAFMTG